MKLKKVTVLLAVRYALFDLIWGKTSQEFSYLELMLFSDVTCLQTNFYPVRKLKLAGYFLSHLFYLITMYSE